MLASAVLQIILFCINNLLFTLLNLLVFGFVYLTCVNLKRHWARRVAPDGRKAIVITGATSGFGLVMAKYFHKMGFTVIATYFDKTEHGYKQLGFISSSPINEHLDEEQVKDDDLCGDKQGDKQKMLKNNYLFLVPLDVSSKKSRDEAKLEIESLLDKYDLQLFCLLNNAGVASDGPFQWVDPENIAKVVETNLLGLMVFTRQFIFRIIKDKGRVVNVSSGLQDLPGASTSIYGSTKSGIAYFSDALNIDIRHYGASSRCVIPGNLTTSTNIVFSRIYGAKRAIEKLNDEERSFYERAIRKYMVSFGKLAHKALGTSNMSVEELNQICGLSEERLKLGEKKREVGMIARVSKIILIGLSGAIKEGLDLDRSYVTKSFDDAVRLVHCPSRVYSGNFMYTHYFGPMMDLLPYDLIHASINLVFKFKINLIN